MNVWKVLHVTEQREKPSPRTNKVTSSIIFTNEDYATDNGDDGDPIMVLGTTMSSVSNMIGCSADVLFYGAFKAMKLSNKKLIPYDHDLVGFMGDRATSSGTSTLDSQIISTVTT